ncbi:MAG: threonine/serine dehydratase [Chloroflexota bacterium]
MDIEKEILRAEQRIRPHIRQTILDHSPALSQMGGANVFCKLENLQYTGSFKVRGALNKILSLTDEERACGVITASTGNHGAATAFSLNKVGASGLVCVPEHAVETKVKAIERLGADIYKFGDDGAVTEGYARQRATDEGLTFISPYNDPQIVAGQGTIGVELTRQLDQVDAVFVALGGGGLISGIATYLKSVQPNISIIGCSPINSYVMIQSIQAGQILDLPSLPTLSDGTAGGVEPGSITFDICREQVDDYVTVSEAEIADSLRLFMDTHHQMIEGAAAVAIAAYLKTQTQWIDKNVVIIICGGNISLDTLKEIL